MKPCSVWCVFAILPQYFWAWGEIDILHNLFPTKIQTELKFSANAFLFSHFIFFGGCGSFWWRHSFLYGSFRASVIYKLIWQTQLWWIFENEILCKKSVTCYNLIRPWIYWLSTFFFKIDLICAPLNTDHRFPLHFIDLSISRMFAKKWAHFCRNLCMRARISDVTLHVVAKLYSLNILIAPLNQNMDDQLDQCQTLYLCNNTMYKSHSYIIFFCLCLCEFSVIFFYMSHCDGAVYVKFMKSKNKTTYCSHRQNLLTIFDPIIKYG